jgi:hypothetical protein
MANGKSSIGAEIGSIPIAEMVRTMAMAVADAQFELDKSSLMVAEFMSGQRPLRDPDTAELVDHDGKPASEPVMVDSRVQFGYDIIDGRRVPRLLSLMELGFAPTFYQFVDTVIEVKLALRLNKVVQPIDPATGSPGSGGEASGFPGRSAQVILSSTPIDGAYAAGYGFNVELASVFRTKLVPVPPPPTLEARLRDLVQKEASSPSKESDR